MVRVRVRQHVNPLSFKYQQPIQLPDWSTVYTNINQPFHLDLGCARGKFLISLAQIQTEMNFLGIEIRQPLVKDATKEVEKLGLKNVYFLFGNANNYLKQILASIPQLQLQSVTIQFPDPWFKKRHEKRKIVQQDLVNVLDEYLLPGGIVFLQSDLEKIAQEMCDRFIIHPGFTKKHPETWLELNPFSIATEREKVTLDKNQPVYRVLFQKNLI
ncbi:tRNA (guanosine(46)-N7)-methyltransferase TrmB [Gloeocapsa sp. PCC 73106]|uniref:tRNA (guanosine(46)-N7)-methyltransferase TrmB n=1 Tax=Gloeocapsa sp. PCC 73106 TaxID=102232 RepID=UPI0002AD165C|nr:tRNA (guanosine(46)-N7)-methyltransferase TrmB [Gloeocapsa sp. PCC 73106]ELR98507.1 tRNA (guanine-N(7)-)-methyltransferase [Gloeocapsa sp. PCC 73106]